MLLLTLPEDLPLGDVTEHVIGAYRATLHEDGTLEANGKRAPAVSVPIAADTLAGMIARAYSTHRDTILSEGSGVITDGEALLDRLLARYEPNVITPAQRRTLLDQAGDIVGVPQFWDNIYYTHYDGRLHGTYQGFACSWEADGTQANGYHLLQTPVVAHTDELAWLWTRGDLVVLGRTGEVCRVHGRDYYESLRLLPEEFTCPT